MKKFIIKPYELEQPLDAGGQAASLRVSGPAKLRKVVLGAKPAPPPLIATKMEDIQKPQLMLVPVFMFECDPDAEEVEKTFLITPSGKLIDSTTDDFEYRDSLLYPDGKLFFVYEVM